MKYLFLLFIVIASGCSQNNGEYVQDENGCLLPKQDILKDYKGIDISIIISKITQLSLMQKQEFKELSVIAKNALVVNYLVCNYDGSMEEKEYFHSFLSFLNTAPKPMELLTWSKEHPSPKKTIEYKNHEIMELKIKGIKRELESQIEGLKSENRGLIIEKRKLERIHKELQLKIQQNAELVKNSPKKTSRLAVIDPKRLNVGTQKLYLACIEERNYQKFEIKILAQITRKNDTLNQKYGACIANSKALKESALSLNEENSSLKDDVRFLNIDNKELKANIQKNSNSFTYKRKTVKPIGIIKEIPQLSQERIKFLRETSKQ